MCVGEWESPLKLNPRPGLYSLYDSLSHCPGTAAGSGLLMATLYPPCRSSHQPRDQSATLDSFIASPSETPNSSVHLYHYQCQDRLSGLPTSRQAPPIFPKVKSDHVTILLRNTRWLPTALPVSQIPPKGSLLTPLGAHNSWASFTRLPPFLLADSPNLFLLFSD